jgi:DNA-binding CsgD family transcriptional regulator
MTSPVLRKFATASFRAESGAEAALPVVQLRKVVEPVDSARIEPVLSSVGGSTFTEAYGTYLEQRLGVDDYLVIEFYRTGDPAPYVLMGSPKMQASLGPLYSDVMHRFDPNQSLIAAAGQDDHVRNTPLWSDAHYPEVYKAWVNAAAGVVDAYAYVFASKTSCYYINYYKTRRAIAFDDVELANIRDTERLLAQAVAQHFGAALVAAPVNVSPEYIGKVLKAIPATASLSDRENQVCSLILMGNSSESIALLLGISRNSVLTYRRRAYERLRITSQHELFVAVIQHVSRRAFAPRIV